MPSSDSDSSVAEPSEKSPRCSNFSRGTQMARGGIEPADTTIFRCVRLGTSAQTRTGVQGSSRAAKLRRSAICRLFIDGGDPLRELPIPRS